MMKRILLALALLVLGQAAFADSFGPAGQQPTVLSPAGTNIIGDGSTTQGGIAPALTDGSNPQELADIADNFTLATYLVAPVVRCSYPVGGAADSVACARAAVEAKERTLCNFALIGRFDPIVSPGTANFGHLHMFWGNLAVTKDSDYSQLRQNGESTCAGDKANRTAYWAPAMMEDLTSGVSAVRVFDSVVVYYTNAVTDAAKVTRIPRGFRYIGGYDPADPNNTKLTVPIGVANATAGFGRYAVPNGLGSLTSTGTGFLGWQCLDSSGAGYNGSNANSPLAGQAEQPYLRNAAGQSTLTCPAGGGLEAELAAPDCWDGKNLGSAAINSGGVIAGSGRGHVYYKVHDNNTGADVCFTSFYWLPQLTTKIFWSLSGVEDVGKFWLSSDRMNYGPPDPTSRSPCRQVSSYYCNGETMHFDWFGAWSYGTAASPSIMIRWMNHCAGAKIVMSGTTLASDPGECDTSTIDKDNGLQTNGTTAGGLPYGNGSLALRGAAATSKWKLEGVQTGTFVIQHTH